MRFVFALFVLVAVAAVNAESLNAEVTHDVAFSPAESAKLFTQFVAKYRKSFSTSTFATKLKTFTANLKKIVALTAAKTKARFGVTKFSDLSASEFRAYMGARAPARRSLIEAGADADADVDAETEVQVEAATEATMADFKTGLSWASKFKVPRHQGGCGSCWSFSTAGVIEGTSAIKGGSNAYVSTQHLVDCARGTPCGGCSGGYITCAGEHARTQGYFMETDMPYVTKQRTCNVTGLTPAGKIKSYNMIRATPNDFVAGLKTGPMFITMDAAPLQLYQSGILTSEGGGSGTQTNARSGSSRSINCSGSAITHAMVAVGYGQEGETPYFLIRNSWGQDWGMQGMYKHAANGNVCGLYAYAGYTVTL